MAIKLKCLQGSEADIILAEIRDYATFIKDYTATNSVLCYLGQYVQNMWAVTVPANLFIISYYIERIANNYYEPTYALDSGVGTTSLKFSCFCPSYSTAGTTDVGVSVGAYRMHVIGIVP